MDIEFHYYMMYLIAAKSGFSAGQSHTIACSSQFTDDNHTSFEILGKGPDRYINHISQTETILKPRQDLSNIYLLFHYIPGNPASLSAKRKDGITPPLITTSDSDNANKILDEAIKSQNLYWLGIACHAYADTFAHENFTGLESQINSIDNTTAAVGHSEAGFNPDWPGLVWHDERLIDKLSLINNKEKIKSAAGKIYRKLRKFKSPGTDLIDLTIETNSLLSDLDWAIGSIDHDNSFRKLRIVRYKSLSLDKEYGGEMIKGYDKEEWFSKAVQTDYNSARLRWSDPNKYRQTDWYRFQEAVKDYQASALKILKGDLSLVKISSAG